MSPFERASIAAMSPISLVSRFSSLWVTIAVVPFKSDAGVHAALADDVLPDRLACPDFDRVDGAVTAAGHQQPRAVDIRDNRR